MTRLKKAGSGCPRAELVRHASESLAAIGEGIETGRVGREPATEDGDLAADPARPFGDRAIQVLDAWTSPRHRAGHGAVVIGLRQHQT